MLAQGMRQTVLPRKENGMSPWTQSMLFPGLIQKTPTAEQKAIEAEGKTRRLLLRGEVSSCLGLAVKQAFRTLLPSKQRLLRLAEPEVLCSSLCSAKYFLQ